MKRYTKEELTLLEKQSYAKMKEHITNLMKMINSERGKLWS